MFGLDSVQCKATKVDLSVIHLKTQMNSTYLTSL